MTRIRFIGKFRTLKPSLSPKKPSPDKEETISEETNAINPQEEISKPRILAEYKETIYAHPSIEKTRGRNFEFIETSIDTLDKNKSKSEIERAVDRILARKYKK
ncbi:MAG: hypothetical protein DRN12_08215 [Thermoplasmata archaeon]|nr:MAG: hypothetical protein DRN12_08215 [Thermoplasmata archaeon]